MSAAAAAAPAGSLLAAGAARARIPGDCGSPGHDPGRRSRALSSCRQAIEGAFAVNDDAMLHDAKLQEVAQRLGAGAAERLDVERTARAVVERLRAGPRAERWTWVQPAWLRIAAAAILVIGGGLFTRALVWQRAPGSAGVVPVGEGLAGLTGGGLREGLAGLEQPGSGEGGGDSGGGGVQPAWLRIAAAAILVIGGGLFTRALVWQRAPGSAVVVPVGEDLTDLTAEQLREALTVLDQPVSEEGAGDTGVEGLTAEELRA